MAEFENTIADAVAAEMGAGEAPGTQPGMTPMHGGPGTAPTLNYDKDAGPGGEIVGMNEGSDTRPLAGDYVAPSGDVDGVDTMEARDAAYAAAVHQKKVDIAATAESLRRFHRAAPASTGYVPGLEHLEKRIRK